MDRLDNINTQVVHVFQDTREWYLPRVAGSCCRPCIHPQTCYTGLDVVCPPTKHTLCVARCKHYRWQSVSDRRRGQGGASPASPVAGRFEHYMMPYVRFPFTSRVVAMNMLSFRLKGSSRSSGSPGKRGSGDGDGIGTHCHSAAHSRANSSTEAKRSVQQQLLRTTLHKGLFYANGACAPVVARQIISRQVGRA